MLNWTYDTFIIQIKYVVFVALIFVVVFIAEAAAVASSSSSSSVAETKWEEKETEIFHLMIRFIY